MIVDLPIRSLVEYDSRADAPLSATAGPEGSVIITYTDRVDVLAEIPSDSKTLPEPVAAFTKVPPTVVSKKKKVQKNTQQTVPFDKFSHTVQFHEESNRFVAITDNLNLTSWPATHGSTLFDAVSNPVYTPSAAKKPSATPIHSFHTSRRIPKHVIVVDHSGNPTLHTIVSSAPSTTTYPASAPVNVLFAGFINVKEGTNPVVPRFVTITVNGNTAVMNVYVLHYSGSPAQPTYTHIARASSLEIPTQSGSSDVLVSVAVHNSTPSTSFSLSLLWASGWWQVYNVSATAAVMSNTTAAAVLTTIQSKQLTESLCCSVSASTSLTFVSPQHVLLAGLLQHDPDHPTTLPPLCGNIENIPAKSVFSVILETSYATVSGATLLAQPEPLLTNGQLIVTPLESTTYSSPALILTPTHLYLLAGSLPRPSLLQVMGLAHQSAPFFRSPLNKQPSAVSSVAPAAVSAQLVTTPSPFVLPHCASATLAQVATTFTQPSTGQAFVHSLMQSWGAGVDGEFCQHVQNEWSSFATSADQAERRILSRMFPALASLLGEAQHVITEAQEQRKTKKTKTNKTDANTSNEKLDVSPRDFILNFFTHTACRQPLPTFVKDVIQQELSAEDIERLIDSPVAWSTLAASALKYTGQHNVIATLNVVERNNKKLVKQLTKDKTTKEQLYSDEALIAFAQPLSPLFIALVARYCLYQLQEIPATSTNDDRLLFLLPLRVLVCSQALSARLVPTFLPLLLRLQQWSMAQEVLVAVPDLAEHDIVSMLQVTLDGWACSISDDEPKVDEKPSKKRKASSNENTLTASLQGKALTPAAAKLLVLSIIKAPLSKRFLQFELKALDLSHVLILLKYLLGWTQALWLEGDTTVSNKRKRFLTTADIEKGVEQVNKQRAGRNLKPLSKHEATKMFFKRYNKTMSKDDRTAESTKDKEEFDKLSEAGSIEAYVSQQNQSTFEAGMFSGVSAVNLLAPHGLSRPSLFRVIEWTSSLLDAHFARIVLLINASTSNSTSASTSIQQGLEALEVMNMLKDVISNYHTDICTEIQTLQPFLRFWDKQVRGNTSIPLPIVSDYSISLMKL